MSAKYFEDLGICQPALVYFVIATVLGLASSFLMMMRSGNLAAPVSGFSSNMIWIIVCTLALAGLCNISPNMSWALVIIWIICTISFLGSFVLGSMESKPLMNLIMPESEETRMQ